MARCPYAPDDRRDGVVGLSFAMRQVAQLLLMCDRQDIGVSHRQRRRGRRHGRDRARGIRPPCSNQPRIFIYDNYPGGIGFSQPLFGMHADLLAPHAHDDCRLRVRARLPDAASVPSATPGRWRSWWRCASSICWRVRRVRRRPARRWWMPVPPRGGQRTRPPLTEACSELADGSPARRDPSVRASGARGAVTPGAGARPFSDEDFDQPDTARGVTRPTCSAARGTRSRGSGSSWWIARTGPVIATAT